jgi:hypothetical protein
MRQSFVLLSILFLLAAESLSAQNLSGYWEGKIALTKTDSLTIGLQIDYQGDTLYAELDSPDQYFTGQPVSDLRFEDSVLSFRVPDFRLNYEGRISPDGQRFTGTCTQYGKKFDCMLSQGAQRKFFPRPQTPVPPYPYRTEEVNFRDRDGKKPLINGTLTMPNGHCKGLVIFISGSGWQDRDESLYAHKPFAVIADTLTKAGFATYRFDDFPQSIFRKSTTYDFADGVRLILDSLLQRPDLQNLKIGLLGHSEGSLVASMVAADDKRVGFTIHLGGVAQPFEEILLYQSEAILRVSGEMSEKEIQNSIALNKRIYEVIKKSKSTEDCMAKVGKLWDEISAQLTDEEKAKYNLTPENKFTAIQTFGSPWFYTLFHIDVDKYLKKCKKTPILAISGEKDLQIDAIYTLNNINKYLDKGVYHEEHLIMGANHLLQPCTTGSPDEYPLIETTIAPEVLDTIVEVATSFVTPSFSAPRCIRR